MSVALNTIPPRPPSTHSGGHRLLWWALGASLLVHLAILLPRYGFFTKDRLLDGNRTLSVTLLAKGSPAGDEAAPQAAAVRRVKKPPARPAVAQRSIPTPIASRAHSDRPAPVVRPTQHGLPSIDQLIAQAAPPARQPSQNIGSGGTRHVTLTNGMKDYRYGQYFDAWKQKVERLGAMNYPEEARDKSGGQLVLAITLRADGRIASMSVTKSSGNEVYDKAALRIARMGEPYAPFPPDIRKETDYMDIVRVWNFTRSNRLETR